MQIPEENMQQIDEELKEYAAAVAGDGDSDVYDEDYLVNDDELLNYSGGSVEPTKRDEAQTINEFSDGEDMLDDGIRSVVDKVQQSVDNDLDENLELPINKIKAKTKSPTIKTKHKSQAKKSKKKSSVESDKSDEEDHNTESAPPPSAAKKEKIRRPKTIASTMKEWEVEIYSDTDAKGRGGKKSKKKLKSYKCKLCLKVCLSKNSLHYHFLSHTGERPYVCDECGKGFFAASALKVHLRLHSGEKPFNCDACGRGFRQWGDLKYHIASLHAENKNHQCEFCGKEFARRYSLVIHRRIHTGERNYKCEHCGKSFRASSYLQDHRRIHTGEKPHACEHCGKCFRIRSDLKRHWNIHLRDGSATTASARGIGGKDKLVSKKVSAASTETATAAEAATAAQNIIAIDEDESMQIKIEIPTLCDGKEFKYTYSLILTINYFLQNRFRMLLQEIIETHSSCKL